MAASREKVMFVYILTQGCWPASPVSSSFTAPIFQNAMENGNQKSPTVIDVLNSLLKAQTGQEVSDQNVAQLLISNMTTLVQQGKLSQQQILQARFPCNSRFFSLE